MQLLAGIVLGLVIGCLCGVLGVANLDVKKFGYATINASKNLGLFQMANQWVKVKQDGRNIADYLKEHSIKRVAIYGISYAGNTLIRELNNQDIEIVYGIDKRKNSIYSEIDLRLPEEVTDDVDAVIVTAIFYYEDIKVLLQDKLKCPIISLETIIEELCAR